MAKIQIADKQTLDAVYEAVDAEFVPLRRITATGSAANAQGQTVTSTLCDIQGKGEVVYMQTLTAVYNFTSATLKITLDDDVLWHVKWTFARESSVGSYSATATLFGMTRSKLATGSVNGGYYDDFSPELQTFTQTSADIVPYTKTMRFYGQLKFSKRFKVEWVHEAFGAEKTAAPTLTCDFLLYE